MNSSDLLLYAITDRSRLGIHEPLSEAVKAALEGGITLLQLREKNMSEEDMIKCAKELVPLCHSYGVKLIINDNVSVCMQSGADGVHLGQGDMPIEEARRILGDNKIIGITAKTIEQAVLAQRAGADYLGSGAMFVSATKKDALPMSKDTLKSITAAVDIPVVAIGGIDAENIHELKGLGISGVAVVSSIFAQSDKRLATRLLKEKIKAIV